MKKILSFIWEITKIVIIAFLIVVPIRYFLFQPFIVKGESMRPNFETGDYLIIDQISYRFREPQRGEIVVFKYPQNSSQRYIKRIVGLPEETIEIKDGKIIIYQRDGQSWILNESSYLSDSIFTSGDIKITLAENEYFVLGDNRYFSADSRKFGPFPKKNIIGRVFLRVWPFTIFTKVEVPSY